MRHARGFTLIEVLVVMGILSILGLFLIQILDGCVTLVGQGEGNRALLDRTSVAQEIVGADLRRMAGPGAGVEIEAGQPSRRVLQDHVALGLSPAPRVDRVPRLRAHVLIERAHEEQLMRSLLRPRAEQEAQTATEREELLDKWVAQQTFTGVGELVLVPWPAGDLEGAYLQLRRAVRLAGRRLRITTALGGSDVVVPSLFEEAALDQPADLLDATEPVLSGLLHLEFRWWSQFTVDPDAEAGRGGPETCWDTARAGLLAQEVGGHRFTLDLGPTALARPLSHVFPHRVEVRMVIDQPPEEARCALLAAPLEETTNELLVEYPERLPYPDGERFVKIGGEWIRYSGMDGGRLTGIRRGVRGTLPRSHAAGARIHAGRDVVLVVPLVGRDCWNG